MKKIIIALLIIIIGILLFFFANFLYQELASSIKYYTPVACTMEAKICPDGSTVGRTGPTCEFTQCPDWKNYKNNEFGFELTFPETWKGYSVIKQNWVGHVIDNYQQTYTGTEIIIKNPQTTATQQWQDIPIMVFTPDVWILMEQEKVSVSAAPIPPAKIGENSKYVFATPPRWYGFTDAIGFQEAIDIVKTFKAF